ncbi:MAG: nucleotidyltransferase domain-containing protein [Thermoproteus sp.]
MDKAKTALKSQREMLARALRFVERVKAKINVAEVYVVGSRARGDYTNESDIDLVIISDDVKGLDALERRLLLKDLLEPGVEYFIYTSEEWSRGDSLWIAQLRREAKELGQLAREYLST